MVDSRAADQGVAIRRRRECLACKRRFTTYERIEATLMVRKRGGVLDPFRIDKVRRGLESALADRPGAMAALDDILKNVEATAHASSPVVESEEIGRAVLEELRDVDEVAYLRFASVYKEFQGASDFEKEMASLEPRPEGS